LGSDRFDEVILACHSDQARSLLEDPGQLEDQLLGSFPYSRSEAVLHSDESLLPRSRRAWAAWNYHLRPDRNSAATLTYNMNLLQHLESDRAFLVTLNETDAIAEDKKIAKFDYAHPVFTTTRRQFQARHAELIRHRRTSYCGAWWGAGFHEDGVNSALQVCHRFGVEDWAREFAPAGDPVHASSSEEAHVV
jgi:predicted NAD/FAD-binding protein